MPALIKPLVKTQISGLVLCGGAGRRMAGRDKGLLRFHGTPLVEIAIHRLAPQVSSVIISANRHLSEYRALGHPVVQDGFFEENRPHYDGPLAGISAAFNALETDWLATVPCDCPLFPTDLISTLIKASLDPDKPRFMSGHPTFSLIPVAQAASITRFLQQGHRKLGDWFSLQQAIAIAPADEEAFRNLNAPEDLF